MTDVTNPTLARVLGMESGPSSWVVGLAAGDVATFEAVFNALHGRLFVFAARMTGSRAVAEEIVQEGFLQLSLRRATLRSDAHVTSWLFTVVRNRCRSHHRWAFIDGTRLLQWGRRRWGGPPDPSDVLAGATVADGVEQVLASMPASEREIALLAWMEGLEPAEIQQVTGLGAEVVRQRLSRARKRLAEYLLEDS